MNGTIVRLNDTAHSLLSNSLKIPFIIPHFRLGFPNCLFPPGFLIKTLYAVPFCSQFFLNLVLTY